MTKENKPLLTYDKESAMGVSKNSYQGSYKRVLCVCSAGILRSATTSVILSQEPFGFNTRACGLEPYALIPITEVLLHWADEIVCMTEYHKACLKNVTDKTIINLDIPDSFSYREQELEDLISHEYKRNCVGKY